MLIFSGILPKIKKTIMSHIMQNIKRHIKIATIILLLIAVKNSETTAVPGYQYLKDLNPLGKQIREYRKDIRTSIIVVKTKKDSENLPELKFYKYKVKKGDNFWKILSQTSLNIDTLSTINGFSSPNDLIPGKTIFLPNMRGVLHKLSKDDTLETISDKYKIPAEYIIKANKITSMNKQYLFIPCAELSRNQRSSFMRSDFIKPVQSMRLTSNFGYRKHPIYNKILFHNGLDYECSVGTPVKAAKKGEVIFTGKSGSYGNLVVLQHSDGYRTYYAHLSGYKVKKGDIVDAGQTVALSGNSGLSTGPHLHFEIRKNDIAINPHRLFGTVVQHPLTDKR